MTAYVKNYTTDEEQETYQQKMKYYENVWLETWSSRAV